MLTLNTILSIWRKDCGASIGVALDRHDNVDHRVSGDESAVCYEPKSGEPAVSLRLDYNEHGDIVQRKI